MLYSKEIRIAFLIVLIFLLSFSKSSEAKTRVSGNVKGKWTKTGSPYLVIGDITVPANDSLIIEAGVEVNFTRPYTFTINGLLKANGSQTEKIIFHGGGVAGSWKQICFTESAKAGCILNYCIIKDGGFHEPGTYDLANIYIVNSDTNITISNCEIDSGDGYGIYVHSYFDSYYRVTNIMKKCSPTIVNNFIHDNGKDGVYVHAYYAVYEISANDNKSIASPLIKNNIICANNSHGIVCDTYANGGDDYWGPDWNPTITTNCTIQQNIIYGNKLNAIHLVVITKVENQPGQLPVNWYLGQNNPNPFNPETFINYQVPYSCDVKIEVFNLLGHRIKTLVAEKKNPGSYQIRWDGSDDRSQVVSSGIYLYKMQAGSFTAIKKMVLVR